MNSKKHVKIIVVIALIAAFGFLLRSGINLMRLETERQQLEKEHAAKLEKEEQLEAELKELDSADYIEQEARSELHMIKDGEVVYIVDPAPEPEDEGPTAK